MRTPSPTGYDSADAEERLQQVLRPPLTDRERAVAQVEGWIIGVGSVATLEAPQ
ncbi:MAG TPA: hypothetical protein VGL01_01975 [Trinickia sp.]|jgi:hypothetical protein